MLTFCQNQLLKRWNHTNQEIKGFFKFEIIINVLVISCRFIWYLCYGSAAIINIFIVSVGIDIRRQNLTSTVDPRAVRIKLSGGRRPIP